MQRRHALQALAALTAATATLATSASMAAGQPARTPAAAGELGALHFDDSTSVAGTRLQLNGAGVRTKVIFKVYAIALYLADKKTSSADVMAAPGPRRVLITMLRDVSIEDFGKAFTDGLNANTGKDERTRMLSQTMQFGTVFGQVQTLKKGDQMQFDWLPGEGTQCYLNGKKTGELMPDLAFYNAVLRIWLGDKPADHALKLALLGEK